LFLFKNYCTQTGPTIPRKGRWSLHVPPSPTLRDGVFFVLPTLYQEQKLRKQFKPPCNANFMHTIYIKISTQILRPINFTHLTNQTGGILYGPPNPTQGGPSSSALVVSTSFISSRVTQVQPVLIYGLK